MKRAQREPWVAIGPGATLCCFCRYADWVEDDCYCLHPLYVVADGWPYGMEPGCDCWGFRPIKGITAEGEAARWAEMGVSTDG